MSVRNDWGGQETGILVHRALTIIFCLINPWPGYNLWNSFVSFRLHFNRRETYLAEHVYHHTTEAFYILDTKASK